MFIIKLYNIVEYKNGESKLHCRCMLQDFFSTLEGDFI